jgi:hypothetical protein
VRVQGGDPRVVWAPRIGEAAAVSLQAGRTLVRAGLLLVVLGPIISATATYALFALAAPADPNTVAVAGTALIGVLGAIFGVSFLWSAAQSRTHSVDIGWQALRRQRPDLTPVQLRGLMRSTADFDAWAGTYAVQPLPVATAEQTAEMRSKLRGPQDWDSRIGSSSASRIRVAKLLLWSGLAVFETSIALLLVSLFVIGNSSVAVPIATITTYYLVTIAIGYTLLLVGRLQRARSREAVRQELLPRDPALTIASTAAILRNVVYFDAWAQAHPATGTEMRTATPGAVRTRPNVAVVSVGASVLTVVVWVVIIAFGSQGIGSAGLSTANGIRSQAAPTQQPATIAELQTSLLSNATQEAAFAGQAQLLVTTGTGVFGPSDLTAVNSAQVALAALTDPATVKSEATSHKATAATLTSQITAIGIASTHLADAIYPLTVAAPALGNQLLAAHPDATPAQRASLTTAVNAVADQAVGGQDDIPNLVNFIAAAHALA